MTKAADDYETIRRRLEELAAEKNLALTGSTVEEEPKSTEPPDDYGMYTSGWRSLAHKDWPYAGSPHEWRGFVKANG